MYLFKQYLMQTAVLKSLTMLVDIQENSKNALLRKVTSRNSKAIEKRVHINPRVSMRQIARDMGKSDRLVRRTAKTELGLKPYKIRKV
ncbi:hypothetical protein TNCV_1470571 [Trichonephila clavipes]|nr:hypothetical protein TNCV_1470571 [Trichonephila clavipes]